MLPASDILILLVLGFIMSIIANSLGIEGGIIFVPVFVLVLGLTAQEAAGISLTTMIFGLGSGSIRYAWQKRIDYKLGLIFGAATVPGAMLGAWMTLFIASNSLKLLLGILIVSLAILMLGKKGPYGTLTDVNFRGLARRLIDREGREFRYVIGHPFLGIIAFFGIGILSGLFGIGVGALRIPVLVLLLGMPMHVAIATSILTMVISSIAGAMIHLDLGHVAMEYVFWLVPAVIIGAQIGAHLAKKASAPLLRKIFTYMLFCVGIIIVVESLFYGSVV